MLPVSKLLIYTVTLFLTFKKHIKFVVTIVISKSI